MFNQFRLFQTVNPIYRNIYKDRIKKLIIQKRSTNQRRFLFISLTVILFLFIGFFAFKNPSITGNILYEEIINLKNWTFSDSSVYSYESSMVEIANGDAKLVSTTNYIYWNTSIETDYSVTSGLHDPSDKTDKVDTQDNDKHKVKKDKLFEVFFSNNLDNGDIVSFYVKGGKETSIYLCELGAVCNTPDHGSIDYDEEEGWYNITLSGLGSQIKIISIVTQDDVDFDYITSSKGSIAKALYDPKDETSKINVKDDDKVDVKKDKLFNIIFDNKLSNGDIIPLYIEDGDTANIYLCDYGEDCSSPGYGLVNFDGNEGWRNITVSGLSESKDMFNINPDEKIKLNYIKAVNRVITQHSSTNISYPKTASIETKDLDISSIYGLLNFHKNDLLNGQDISYYYSTDSGSSWNAIPSNNNLSDVSVSSGKIRIKADISANGFETPIIYDFSVSYSNQVCNENWNLTHGACQISTNSFASL